MFWLILEEKFKDMYKNISTPYLEMILEVQRAQEIKKYSLSENMISIIEQEITERKEKHKVKYPKSQNFSY